MRLLINKTMYGWSAAAHNTKDELKCFIQVGFKKFSEPDHDSCQIKVTNGFMSCFSRNNGEIMPKIIIMDYEIIKRYEKKIESKLTEVVDDLDLPF